MIWIKAELKSMGFLSTKSTKTSEFQTSNVYDLQKSKRGDLWFLLTFLIPLSIIPAKVTYQNSSQSYFIINWIFMQIDLSNFQISFFYPFYPVYSLSSDLLYNGVFLLEILFLLISITVYFTKTTMVYKIKYWKRIFPFYLTIRKSKEEKEVENTQKRFFFLFILFQFLRYWFYLSLPGQTFYNIAMVIQAYLFLLAVIFRVKQYYDKKNGKMVESGVVGLIAFIIIFLEVVRFLFSQLYISQFYLETHSLSWKATGTLVSNTLIGPLSIFPFPFLSEILASIGFSNVSYPITLIIILYSIPFGIIIPCFWAYKEYKAYPNAFSHYVTKFLRSIIITIFVIVSTFPLTYMFLVSFNDNTLLKLGYLPIWPFNPTATFTISSWEAFGHFVINSGYSAQEAIFFTFLTLLFIFLSLFSVYKRKIISAFFEQLLGEKYRETIINLSWLIIIFLQFLSLMIIRYLLLSINKFIRYNVDSSNVVRLFLETLNESVINSLGEYLLNYILLDILIIYLVIFLVMFLASKGKIWFLFPKMEMISRIFNIISAIIYLIIAIAVIVTNVLLLFTSDIRFAVDTAFQDILWFDIAFVSLTIFVYYTSIKGRRLRLIDNLEGFFLEDGFPFTIALILLVFAVIFGIFSDNSYNWMYFQQKTNALFPVGDWFFITISLCTVVSLFSIVLASLSGYALSRYRFYGRGLIGAMILSTQIFPGVILVLPTLIIFKELGLTGSLFGLGVAYSVIALPFVTYLLKGFFDSIPVDLEEQAMIDGCTRMQAYRRVVLPLVLPGIASTFIFSFLAMYTEYLFALVIYQGKIADYTISLAMLKVFQADLTQKGIYYNDMAVFAVLVSLPVLFMFTYLQRYLLKGLVAGGTKG